MHMQQPNNPLSHRPYAETRMTNVLKFPRESRKQSLGQGVRVVSSTRVPELYELQSLEGDIWRAKSLFVSEPEAYSAAMKLIEVGRGAADAG
jgi:hypothetical protein